MQSATLLTFVLGILLSSVSVNSEIRSWFSSDQIKSGSHTPLQEMLNVTAGQAKDAHARGATAANGLDPHSQPEQGQTLNATKEDEVKKIHEQHVRGLDGLGLSGAGSSSSSFAGAKEVKCPPQQPCFMPQIPSVFELDKGSSGYFPIIEKVIVIVGGGILILILLALFQAAMNKGGFFHKIWADDYEEDMKPMPRPMNPPPPPMNNNFDPHGQLTQRVMTGVNNRW